MNRAESGDTYLTRELVGATKDGLKSGFPNYDWGENELRNSVFEELTLRFGLPWIELEIGEIPDWNDPRVQKLSQELIEYDL